MEQASKSHTIANAMLRSRAGITRSNAEKTRIKLAAAQEQVLGIEISKHFRRYAADKGYRVPVCLQQLPSPPPPAQRPHTSSSTPVGGRYRPTSVSTTSGSVSRVNSIDEGRGDVTPGPGTGERPLTSSHAVHGSSGRTSPHTLSILTSRSASSALSRPASRGDSNQGGICLPQTPLPGQVSKI